MIISIQIQNFKFILELRFFEYERIAYLYILSQRCATWGKKSNIVTKFEGFSTTKRQANFENIQKNSL